MLCWSHKKLCLQWCEVKGNSEGVVEVAKDKQQQQQKNTELLGVWRDCTVWLKGERIRKIKSLILLMLKS